jgi:hypothetical protein
MIRCWLPLRFAHELLMSSRIYVFSLLSKFKCHNYFAKVYPARSKVSLALCSHEEDRPNHQLSIFFEKILYHYQSPKWLPRSMTMAVFILETHYASGRIIRLLHYSSSIKTGQIIRRTISIYCSSGYASSV